MDYKEAAKLFATRLEELGVTIEAKFTPWSVVNPGKDVTTVKITTLNVNWTVTIRKKGETVLTTPYSYGLGHLKPFANIFGRITTDIRHNAMDVAERGFFPKPGYTTWGQKVHEPSASDVLSSLCLDASVLDFSSFEEWADDYGYDPDSRKAEAIYRACLQNTLALRRYLGDAALTELRDLACEM